MPQVFLMCGLPFSGKTTLSKAISQSLNIPRISFDETWTEIEKTNGSIPGQNEIEKWNYISLLCEDRLTSSLKNGISVIYDNLGDSPTNRNHIMELAQKNHAETKIIYLDVSKEEVLARRKANLLLNERHQVSDKNFFRALDNFQPPTQSESYVKYSPNQEVNTWIETTLIQLTSSQEKK